MSSTEQPDLFLDKDPELKEKYERANFRVSVLGGNQSENDARELGYGLTKKWFPVSTGGYNVGAMKGALEGSNKAIEELKTDPEEKGAVGEILPVLKGITAEPYAPVEMAAKGEYIKTEVAEGEYGVYLRLAKLIEDSEVCIVLPGDTGTELEVLANLHFDKNLKSRFKVEGSKPIIFIGGTFRNAIETKFTKLLQNNQNIFQVTNIEESIGLTQNLFKKSQLIKDDKDTGEEFEKLKQEVASKLIRIQTEI